jgi:RNA-directed DNA polymerase
VVLYECSARSAILKRRQKSSEDEWLNDNWPMLEVFRRKVRRMAKRHLSRRSQNSYLNWEAFNRFTDLHPLVGPSRLTDLIALD